MRRINDHERPRHITSRKVGADANAIAKRLREEAAKRPDPLPAVDLKGWKK